MGIDIWDADPANVQAVWIDDGLATYPLLVKGSGVASDYGVGQDYYFVIDHEGIVRYRSGAGPLGDRFVDGEIREAIEASLEDLAEFLEEEEEEEEEVTTEVAASPQLPGPVRGRAGVPESLQFRNHALVHGQRSRASEPGAVRSARPGGARLVGAVRGRQTLSDVGRP